MAFQNYNIKSAILNIRVQGCSTQAANGLYTGQSPTWTKDTYTLKKTEDGYWGLYSADTLLQQASTVTDNPWYASWPSIVLLPIYRSLVCTAAQGRQIAIVSAILYNDSNDQSPSNMFILNNGQQDTFKYGLKIAPKATVMLDTKLFIPSSYSLFFQTNNDNICVGISASQDKVR